MAFRVQHQGVRGQWPADILFLALTLGPWVVLLWLLLSPRH
jgi:hypothetical protein